MLSWVKKSSLMSEGTLIFGAILLGVAVLSFLVTGLFRSYAVSRLMDIPNDRSSHTQPTPRGGGFGVIVALTGGVFLVSRLGHLPPSLGFSLLWLLPLALVGFLDDHFNIPARWRFLVQITAAMISIGGLGADGRFMLGGEVIDLGFMALPLSLLFIVWFLNLFNFMDGIDGLEAVEAIFVLVASALLSGSLSAEGQFQPEAEVALIASAAVFGFLVWNWPPAKIFLGDIGSGPLGFLVAILALYSLAQGRLTICLWLILSGVFVVDATFTLLVRFFRGERWFEAHRSHAYQHAAMRYGSHARVTVMVTLINLLWLLPMAFLARLNPEKELWILAAAWLPLILLASVFKAGSSGWEAA